MGVFIGVGVALLMAPTSGEETRQRLQNNLEQAQMKVNMTVQDYQAKARQVSDISRQTMEETKSSFQAGASEAMDVIKTS